MLRKASEENRSLPERLVGGLLARLKVHLLWDSLLIFFPPLLVFAYLAGSLYGSAWMSREMVIFASVILLGMALLLGALRQRHLAPSAPLAAHLIDERVQGQDRFLTLATIDPSLVPSPLLSRLDGEAAGLLHRVDLKRDFPYRLKRSSVISWTGSLVALLLFQLASQFGLLSWPQPSPAKDLATLAEGLSQVPRYAELARSLEALAQRVDKQDLSSAERQSLIRELLKKIEEQLSAGQQQAGMSKELLSEAAGTLRQMEREQGQGRDQKSGGGLRTNLPEQGNGPGKESGDRGDGGDKSALLGQGNQGEKSAQKRKGQEKGQGEENRGAGDRSKGDEEKGRETGGPAGGAFEEKGGKGKTEEIPGGATPERFAKPGEQGEKGIKDARFVTVQLPEDELEGSTGEGGSVKTKTPRARVPVGNVPLRPPSSPDAPSEKQHLPLEYRGLIR